MLILCFSFVITSSMECKNLKMFRFVVFISTLHRLDAVILLDFVVMAINFLYAFSPITCRKKKHFVLALNINLISDHM